MKTIAAAIAACLALPVVAQSLSYTPSAQEVKQAQANAKRDAKLADSMEKARLKEEARPASVYIPKAEAVKETKETKETAVKKPETFTATVPGSGKKAPKKKA